MSNVARGRRQDGGERRSMGVRGTVSKEVEKKKQERENLQRDFLNFVGSMEKPTKMQLAVRPSH